VIFPRCFWLSFGPSFHTQKELFPASFRHQKQFYKRHLKINELSPFNCSVVSKQQAGWQESRLVSLQVQETFIVSVVARMALKLAVSRIQRLPESSPAKENRLGLQADLQIGAKLRMWSYTTGPQVFQNSRSHLKNLGARRVTRGKSHTKGPQILYINNILNLVSRVARVLCTPELYFHSSICLHDVAFNYAKGQLHIYTLK